MRDAQRQLACLQRGLQRRHFRLPGKRKFDLGLNLRRPAHGVALQCLKERAVAVRGVVEIRDRLMELFCREFRQKLLERAEADGTLVKILVRFRLLEADRVLHKVIHAPVALLRVQIACAVRRFDQCQDAARVVCFCAQEFRDGRDVLHQTGHVAERVMIDLLQNIAAAAGRHGQIRRVDMPAAIRLAGDRLRVQAEAAQNFKQRFAHLIAPFSSFLHLILPRCGRQQVFRICAGSDKIQAEFEKTVVCGAKLW